MADPTDVTLPITTAQIRRAVETIVEQAHPRPRGELCLPVGEMERQLTAYAGDLVHAAYQDHAGVVQRDLADTIAGSVENGPWKLITDPSLRRRVGEYVAETCHSIAAAAGLDEAMEYAHNAMPVRLATGGRLVDGDARERLARHLYLNEWGDYPDAADRWDNRQVDDSIRSEFLADADAALNVITGMEN